MPTILGANTESAAYEVSNSLRFNDDDSPKVSRSISSSGSARNATLSVWVKSGNLGTRQQIYSNKTASSGFSAMNMYFNASNDRLYIDHHDGSSNLSLYTTQVFRDVSAWYHIVHTIDTTTATATNRLRLYINGTEVTDFATDNNPSQNADLAITNSTGDQSIGDDPRDSSDLFDGYMAEFNFVDGTTLDPTYFGETNDNGVWVPKKPDVSSYGTNGFFLEFKQTGTSANSSGIGADTSGNDNHMSVTNLASTDVTEDTPTNNFATLNPLIGNSGITYSEGNLQFSQYYNTASTIAVANGKWYLEMKILNDNTYNPVIGIAQTHTTLATIDVNDYHGNVTDSYGISREGNLFANGSNIGSQGFTLAQNDIVGVALDLDSGTKTIKWYKNGSQVATRNLSETQSNPYVFGTYASSSQAGQGSFNFGNPAFSISSGNADANGYGNFEYAPPSGYYSLCTKNLAEFG